MMMHRSHERVDGMKISLIYLSSKWLKTVDVTLEEIQHFATLLSSLVAWGTKKYGMSVKQARKCTKKLEVLQFSNVLVLF